MIWAVIPAAGKGSRAGLSENKMFEPIGGIPMLVRTLQAFEASKDVDAVCLACAPGEIERIKAMVREYGIAKAVLFAEGGTTRQQSVHHALRALPDGAKLVLIHDGARPFVSGELIARCVRQARESGACVPVLPVVDTIKTVRGGTVLHTPERSELYRVQTPQTFELRLILEAYDRAERDGFTATDDASVAEHAGKTVYCISGEEANVKMTTPGDFESARSQFDRKAEPILRIGQGYDAHRLTEGRRLVLCGVEIPYEYGLLGHSDADAATHALMDAMLGACGQGDIGKLFPDSDERYRGIDSQLLLAEVVRCLDALGWTLSNADVTIVAQRPKLAPFREQMRETLAQTIGCGMDQISVKATTTEQMGFEGRKEGISATAVVLMTQKR